MAQPRGGSGRFITTRWSVVIAAGEERRDALSALCSWYWSPLYSFVRHRGASADEAVDLTQGFFLRLLEKRDLAAADPARGRFRSWLLTAFKHYQANQWIHDRALKRGGGEPHFSLDAREGEGRYLDEPSHTLTPERLYENRWANLVVERVLGKLRAEQERLGNGALFARVQGFLVFDPPDSSYAELAAEFPRRNADALKTWVSRLGNSFRQLLRDEIAETVASPAEIDDELRHLIASLAPGP